MKRLIALAIIVMAALPAVVLANNSTVAVNKSNTDANCVRVLFTHRGYAGIDSPGGPYKANTKANEIIFDNNAKVSDTYRDLGNDLDENGWTVERTYEVPLVLNPGHHTLIAKVEVNGVEKANSGPIEVDCGTPVTSDNPQTTPQNPGTLVTPATPETPPIVKKPPRKRKLTPCQILRRDHPRAGVRWQARARCKHIIRPPKPRVEAPVAGEYIH